jgi:hypothetical protein
MKELIHADFYDYSAIEAELTGFNACFFCLGVSSIGMSEATYRRVTFDLTMKAASTLAKLNPEMTFCYITGAGTDSIEKGTVMWARVKGMTENRLMELPSKQRTCSGRVSLPLERPEERAHDLQDRGLALPADEHTCPEVYLHDGGAGRGDDPGRQGRLSPERPGEQRYCPAWRGKERGLELLAFSPEGRVQLHDIDSLPVWLKTGVICPAEFLLHLLEPFFREQYAE